MSSSIPGLGSSMDMSMNAMTEEQEIALVKLCDKTKMFSFWKFYSRDGDGKFTHNEREMCGFLICNTPETKTPKNEEWWLKMQKHVVKAITDHRNNVIKSVMIKLKERWKQNVAGIHHNLNEESTEELSKLKSMRENICHYANIIDDFAPCIVLSKVWNDDVKMNLYCNTSDPKPWANKILSISDEAFLLFILINYT